MIPAISTEVIKAREHANEVVRKKKHHMHAPLLPDRTRGCIPQRRGVETTPRALRSRSFRHGRQYQCHRRSGSGRPGALQRPRTLTHLHTQAGYQASPPLRHRLPPRACTLNTDEAR